MSGSTDPLAEYRARRDPKKTPEPAGKRGRKRKSKLRFLVQKHDATRLHYDFRLEWDGVLKSWAVTRGPSVDPADKRLAVRTEDHPISYGDFEGVIPKGEYGGGTVMLWDTGEWEPLHDPTEGLANGKLHFALAGARMKGEWALVRMRPRKGEKRENWLLIKVDDERAHPDGKPLTERFKSSVTTGRRMRQIASQEAATSFAKKTEEEQPAKQKASATRKTTQGGKPPKFAQPQLAKLVDAAPEGDDWLHEVKFDGYRSLLAVGGGQARCYTRSGLDWTDKFAEVAAAAAGLDCGSALIDGEIVAAEAGKDSSFSALQAALKDGGPLRFYAFDLLSVDGDDLRKQPLGDRKQRLKALVGSLDGSDVIKFSDHVRGNGPRMLAEVCKAGQEGIVSKRADAPYVGRRSDSWRKVKCTKRQEFVIAGTSPSDKRGRAFASLLLGTYEDGRLVYRGRVGTGFSEDAMADLAERFRPLARKTSPFDSEVPAAMARDARWLTPKLVAEVDFTEFTADGHVRHGAFIGLRDDKGAGQVTLETKMSNDEAVTVAGVRISHPDRVVYPQQGVTKETLARYYEKAAKRMLAYAGDRPLSLVRCPQGRGNHCFFQKHPSDGFPDELARVPIKEKDGGSEDYLYATDAAGLVAAVQMGTLEFHIWWSKVDKLDRPDRLVFDLDPDEGLSFAIVRDAAFEVRDGLKQLGLQSVPMVTGGKGVHVVVPLERRADAADCKAFAEGFARRMAAESPDRYTATMSKAKRKGRIFLDWLRNQRGSTAIAPYSTRAREGAPVAMPVTWAELKKLDKANGFHLDDALKRLDRADPWAETADWRQSITQAMLAAVD